MSSKLQTTLVIENAQFLRRIDLNAQFFQLKRTMRSIPIVKDRFLPHC